MSSPAYRRFQDESLSLYAPPRRRKSTFLKVRKVLDEFGRLPGMRRVSDITPLAMTRWLDEYSHRAPMTNKSYLGAFRPCVNYAKKMGYLKVSPWEIRTDWVTFDLDEEDEPEARHLTLAELESYLAQLDAEAICGTWRDRRRQALGYTYVHTGLRKMEALGLKVSDLDLGHGVIRIRSRRKRKLKTRSSVRLVGIAPDLAVILERWIPQAESEWLFPGARRLGPWTGGPVGYKPLDELKAVGERAKIPGVTIHGFRRSLATHAWRFGIPRDEVRDWLGHGSVATQEEWYLEQDAANKREAAGRIQFRPQLLPLRPAPTIVIPEMAIAN